MKLWELSGICRDNPSVFAAELGDPRWADIAEDYSNLGLDVTRQNRRSLDQILPTELVERVLINHGGVVFCDGAQLRSYRMHTDDEEFPFVEVYRRYGGSALEDVLEKGSLSVECAEKMKVR